MRLADKQDDMAESTPPEDVTSPPDSKAVIVYAEKPKAAPAASLSASLVLRRHDSWEGIQVEQIEPRATPKAPDVSETRVRAPVQEAMPNAPEITDEPIGVRAQQAILEKAFEALEPVEATAPIERSEFQSARDSAAGWRIRRGRSSNYWERVIKDVSIFTIFFAVLVLVILQAM
ncbi:MAG: hypothetical protein ACI8S3_002772 [Alphaproteobacteria bacterium]|jgi:hypothetical protein